MTYAIGITRSLGTWDSAKHHVERELDNSAYDNAHPDNTLLLAGPARRDMASPTTTSGHTLFALGIFQQFQISTSAPIQMTMAIGSGRGFFLRGKPQSQWSIGRLWMYGRNLLRAIYHSAIEAGIPLDQFDDPAAFSGFPQSSYVLNLDSELFTIPVGFAAIVRTKGKTFCGGLYAELCMVGNWGTQITAGTAGVSENVSGLCDRVLPYQASDAMASQAVNRQLMDAVLGIAPTASPVPSYATPPVFDDSGLGNPNVDSV